MSGWNINKKANLQSRRIKSEGAFNVKRDVADILSTPAVVKAVVPDFDDVIVSESYLRLTGDNSSYAGFEWYEDNYWEVRTYDYYNGSYFNNTRRLNMMTKRILFVLLLLALMVSISVPAMAATYRSEDLARGAMWANLLIDTADEYKNSDGSFKTDDSWKDPHHLLGAIPENQDPYAPIHSSIITMTSSSWAVVGFSDGGGDLLKVWNDPANPEGYDGIVWGNAFYVSGKHGTWSEPGTVYLSQDNTDWWEVPFIAPNPYCNGKNQTFDETPGEGEGLVYPGEPWIFDDDGNKIGETGYAGGDAFDMATAFFVGDWTDPGDDDPSLVGLDWFKYMMVTGEGSGGPDCDSMFVFSTNPVPIPGAVWLIGSAFLVIAGFKRKRS